MKKINVFSFVAILPDLNFLRNTALPRKQVNYLILLDKKKPDQWVGLSNNLKLNAWRTAGAYVPYADQPFYAQPDVHHASKIQLSVMESANFHHN